MYKLGLMYEQGQGVSQNLKKAARYYQKSAKKGYPLGQYRFGLLYMSGDGVKKNSINAYAWLVIAGHYFIYNTFSPNDENNAAIRKVNYYYTSNKKKTGYSMR